MMRGCLIKLQNDEHPDEAVKVHFDNWILKVYEFPTVRSSSSFTTISHVLQDLIDLLIKKLDVDRDGVISEEDFKTAVKERNQLLLECMGPVFPSRDARHVFLSTFTDRVGRYWQSTGLFLSNSRESSYDFAKHTLCRGMLTACSENGNRRGIRAKSDRRDPPRPRKRFTRFSRLSEQHFLRFIERGRLTCSFLQTTANGPR